MKRVLSIICALFLFLSFAACKNSKKDTSSESSDTGVYKVSDSRGTEVAFDKVPEKIISLAPADTEIIYAFGLGEKLIAVSQYCDYPEDTKNKQKLASGTEMNVETIIGLEPDVVVAARMAQAEEQLAQLENTGIKVIVTEANNIAQTYSVIEMLGKAFKVEEKANTIINKMKNDFEGIKEQVKDKPAYKVYIEVSPVAYGPWTSGKDTFQDELLNIVGAKNIFGDISGWKEVSEEQVISRNPDYILTTDVYSYPDPVAEIMGRKSWSNINAVKNKKVFLTDGDKLTTPGPRLADAAKELATILYG